MDTFEKEQANFRQDQALSQFEAWEAALGSWKRQEAGLTAVLDTLSAREKAARGMLAFADALPSDRRNAEQVLTECSGKRARIAESIAGAKRLIESYEQRLAPLRPAYEARRERHALAARMRGELEL